MSILPRIVIASRESRLAMWQAVHVQGRLAALNPDSEVVILGMTTKGDQILDRPLSQIGGKGLFIKELEVAMDEGRAHLAVHSMKDVPMVMPEGFVLAAISARENPRDAFVSNRYAGLDDLPAGAVVGTSSLRREAILRANYPQLVIKSLRGNLDTRLKKLDAGEYDAIILAAAGLIRLGLENRIKSVLTAEQSLPAPGQGALGIELLAGDAAMAAIVAPLERQRDRTLRQGRAGFFARPGRQLPGAAGRLRHHGKRSDLAARLCRHAGWPVHRQRRIARAAAG
jgi:hydroxymethylbilane synthase